LREESEARGAGEAEAGAGLSEEAVARQAAEAGLREGLGSGRHTALDASGGGGIRESERPFWDRYFHHKMSGRRKWPDDLLYPLMLLSFMGESQWEQCRHYLEWPSWREVQRSRKEVMDVVVPTKHVLNGSVESLAAMAEVVRTIIEPYTNGRSSRDQITLLCDALHAKAWLCVDRTGQVSGMTDGHQGLSLPPHDVGELFEDAAAFPAFAREQAAEKRVANACFFFGVTSTRPPVALLSQCV